MSNEREAHDFPSLRFLDQTRITNKQGASFDEDLFLSKIDKMLENRINSILPACISQII